MSDTDVSETPDSKEGGEGGGIVHSPMAETVMVDEMTLAEAAAEGGSERAPLDSARIARMVEEEEARAEEPEQADDFQDDPETATCPQCKGWGATLTGSLVPEETKRQCPFCVGRGWVETYRVPDWERSQKEREAQVEEARRQAQGEE